jgi:hypothetical protein
MPLINNETSAIKLNSEQERAVSEMTSVSEIQQYMRRLSVEQGLAENDGFGGLRETERPTIPANAPHVKSLVVDGTKYLIEGANPAEVAAAELNLLRSLFGGKAAPIDGAAATAQPDRDAVTGRYVASTDDPVAAALAPSVLAALRAADINPEDLQAFSESRRSQSTQSSWEEASELFRDSGIGASWPGGLANRDLLGKALTTLGLDGQPSVESLEKAFRYMQENNQVVGNETLEFEKGVNESTTYEELKSRVGYQNPSLGNQLWGR